MTNPLKEKKGTTVVELIVVAGLISMILYVMSLAMRVGDFQYQTSQVVMLLADSAREGLYKMMQEVREAAPTRLRIVADPNPAILPGNDYLQFCTANPAASVNNVCRQSCTASVSGNNPCPFTSVAGCVNQCNSLWSAAWSSTCNINCTTVCNAYCNADYGVNWKDALRIQYRRGGTGSRQLIRTDVGTGQTTVIANDLNDGTRPGLDLSGSPAASPTVITATLRVRRQLTNERWIPSEPLEMTAQAELRNQ